MRPNITYQQMMNAKEIIIETMYERQSYTLREAIDYLGEDELLEHLNGYTVFPVLDVYLADRFDEPHLSD